MLNRTQRRQQARQERRDNKPVVDGLNAAQLKEAEAELDEGSVSHESSRATTMSALAHSWFALDHQREASRTTYERTKELIKSGRDAKTNTIVQQYAEAKQEIILLETQVVSLLGTVADEDGDEAALALMATTHMNMMNGLGVRFPVPIRTRFAMEAGLADAPSEEEKAADLLKANPITTCGAVSPEGLVCILAPGHDSDHGDAEVRWFISPNLKIGPTDPGDPPAPTD